MKISFKDQVAFVIGAGSGMGLAVAKAFAASGASVAVVDVNEEAAKKVGNHSKRREDHRHLL